MSPQFVYSFDRHTYEGSYPTRAEALARGIARAHELNGAVDTIYVGQRIPGDAQAAGHAEVILKSMRARARHAVGEGAEQYLRKVTDQEEAMLDDAVRDAVLAWLDRTGRTPSFFTVKAVSEHAVPSTPQRKFDATDEVSIFGTSEEPWA
jgi:hypothetical protein